MKTWTPHDHHTDLTQGIRVVDRAELEVWERMDAGDPKRWAKWRVKDGEQQYTRTLSSGRRG